MLSTELSVLKTVSLKNKKKCACAERKRLSHEKSVNTMNEFTITTPFLYFTFMSIVSAAVTIYDKRMAIYGKRRIPERTLFALAILGGSVSMYLTMILIRHKTKHKSFMIGLPVIMILQASALLLLSHFTGFFEYAI